MVKVSFLDVYGIHCHTGTFRKNHQKSWEIDVHKIDPGCFREYLGVTRDALGWSPMLLDRYYRCSWKYFFDDFPQIDLEESASHPSPPLRRGAPSSSTRFTTIIIFWRYFRWLPPRCSIPSASVCSRTSFMKMSNNVEKSMILKSIQDKFKHH